METVGKGITEILILPESEQPFRSVPLILYVVLESGTTEMEEVFSAVLQVNVVTPEAVSITLFPSHTVLVLVNREITGNVFIVIASICAELIPQLLEAAL